MNSNNNLAQDFLSWAYPNPMTRKDKFFEHVLPWLVFLVVPVLLYMLMAQITVVIVVLSGIFRTILNFVGL